MSAAPPASLFAPAWLRLRLDKAALQNNFRWLWARAGVPAMPAIKADGYGLGAPEVLRHLQEAGAQQFAVASWAEALALGRADVPVIVFHGFAPEMAAAAKALPLARPVLVTARQCADWRQYFPGRAADVMVDTGMNRLGLRAAELTAVGSIPVAILHSHLACADEPGHAMNDRQLRAFQALSGWRPHVKRALANSAGICAGPEYCLDVVRPGLGIYGGVPHPAARLQRVVTPEARIIQLRTVEAGESVGYGARWTAARDSRIAILNIGYADGMARLLRDHLRLRAGDRLLPLAGQVSMDMIAVDVTDTEVAEGDWLAIDYDLPALSRQSGLSQYELLVWLSERYQRLWA